MLSRCPWFPFPPWLSFPESIVHLPHLQVDLEFYLTIPWGFHGGKLIRRFVRRASAGTHSGSGLGHSEDGQPGKVYCLIPSLPDTVGSIVFWRCMLESQFRFYLLISAWSLGSSLNFCIYSFFIVGVIYLCVCIHMSICAHMYSCVLMHGYRDQNRVPDSPSHHLPPSSGRQVLSLNV